MKKITVFTKDLYLFQKIRLEALGKAEALLCENVPDALCIFDIDTVAGEAPGGAVTVSRDKDADIKIPFELGAVSALIHDTGSSLLEIDTAARCAVLRGEKIKLTEVEFALFSLIFSKRGEYADRDEILESVWHGEKDAGVINVYVHYLREKLEKNGEKIIISSRKCGYKISEKYLRGDE